MYGLVGCAVTLWDPRGISATPIAFGFAGLLMSIVMKPVLPIMLQESGPPAESAAMMTVFWSWLIWMSAWYTAHFSHATSFGCAGFVMSITWRPPPSLTEAKEPVKA